MDDVRIEPARGYPETPIKLPANSSPAEYGSDAIAELLSKMGWEHVFLLPGSSYRGLHDSLVNHTRNTKPEMILCPTEFATIAAAHGYAKATRKPSLCIIHDLVGLMLGSMSVYNAFADQQPVVILGGSGPLDPGKRRTIDWLHSANAQSDLIKKFCKWTAEPPTLQATLDAIVRARRIAATPPYGPVYISIDQGVQEAKIPANLVMPDPAAAMYQPPAPMAADANAIEHAVEMLLAAKSPLIIAGRIGLNPDASAPLAELVELTGAMYLDDRNMTCLATDHPQNLSGDDAARKDADFVLALECVDTDTAIAGTKPGTKVVDISLNQLAPSTWTNIGGPLPGIDLQIPCGAMAAMAQLNGALRRRLGGKVPDAVAKRIETIKARHDALRKKQREGGKARVKEVPIARAALTDALYDAVKDKDWIITVRNNRGLDEGIFRYKGAGQYLGGDGGGGVGYGPGGAMGAALAFKGSKKLCIALMGDGEMTIGSAAVWTAAHYRIPFLLVVTNNTSWGNDEHHQLRVAAQRGRPQDNAWIGQRMIDPDIDFASLARAYGAWAEGPVTDPAAMPAAFKRAIAAVESGQVAVLDIRVQL
jgi:acetolactate synthase I/II/III large subunit